MATFPYNPTRILSSPTSDDLLYIFQPAASGSTSSQLLALNTTNTLGATKLPFSTISPTLPFLNGPQSAYTPTIDSDGNILVYTGNCTDAAEGSTFWQFTPNSKSSNINGTWKEIDLATGAVSGYNVLDGANYLAAALAFSSTVNATSEMFVFGGMCPNSTSSAADNWTQAAYYSNTMLTMQPESPSASNYDLGITSSRGPPIAEAGFTITPLMPTFFNPSNDNNTRSQNQNFVLLGGHTQTAFINMSQVALFSMPEQSWSFLPIDSPADAPNTDLTARDSTAVDPRSGHTALLTTDGKRVIVFGGWVGDVTNLADPQLAFLELGQGYGGSGDWKWSIPSQTGPGLANGTGIYGHGATMLPGDVMMVVGGYQIPATSNSKRKRTDPSSSANTYFFNTTTNTWITSYVHPKIANSHGSSTNGAGANSDAASKKAGLGAGLTLGVLAIIIVIAVYFWYSRRLKCRRNAREEELRHLAASAHGLNLSPDGSNPTLGRPREMTATEWARDNQLSRDFHPRPLGSNGFGRSEPNAERTGLLFEIPSPTRGLRRSLYSRGTYQPAPRYEDGRQTPGFSTIHPIDERDEYDEELIDRTQPGHNEMVQRDGYNVLSQVPNLDPFQDPMGGSRTPSPQSPQDREHEIRNWVSDWTVANAMMHSQVGRLSPEKNDRTSSTLSDQSSRSGLSSHSIQNSVGNMSRSLSQRSAALFSTAAYRSTNDTTPSDNLQGASQRHSPEHRRSRSLTLDPALHRTVASDNFAAAGPSFSQLQSEGEALLGDYPGSGAPSPTRSHSRARGWMGSVRRAFSALDRSASTSPENNTSNSSSPTKRNFTENGLPRRAASAGAMLWQKRQGARDWDVEGGEHDKGKRGENNEDGDEEEWDVESAVERRVVQVMFTVPKEKLRVVNRGPDGDGESTFSAEVKETGDGVEDVSKEKGKEKE